jgi:hypothetical protein
VECVGFASGLGGGERGLLGSRRISSGFCAILVAFNIGKLGLCGSQGAIEVAANLVGVYLGVLNMR